MFFLNAAIVGYYAAFARGFPAFARATGTGFVLGVGRAGAAGSPIIAGFLFDALGKSELFTVSAIMCIGSVLGAVLVWLVPLRDADADAESHESLGDIRERGFRAVLGDATHAETLKRAGVESSLSLILSASSIHGAAEIIRLAREANPKIKVIVRSAYLRERETLMQSGADTVFAGEGEVAMALAEYILRDLGATADQIDREREKVRSELLS